MPESFGNYGAPTFFVTNIITEQAGGGNVRIWCCVMRQGEMAPVCEIITPAADLIRNAGAAREAAMDAFHEEQFVGCVGAH